MENVNSAEKEATEVLHSLLSVERVKQLDMSNNDQVLVITHPEPSMSNSAQTHQSTLTSCTEVHDSSDLQWHTPVTMQQTLFSSIPDNASQFSGNQVVWQGHTVDVNSEGVSHQSPATHVQSTAQSSSNLQRSTIHSHSTVTVSNGNQENTYTTLSTPAELLAAAAAVAAEEEKKKKKSSKKPAVEKSASMPKKKRPLCLITDGMDANQLEENAQQVRDRFEKGCECQEENCFKGLSAEFVYRHRLNIAELTKAEHDMYLMGVTMAVLTNPDETVRHKERRRLRAQYVFQGRRVCLDAFLYLENCTHYQLKRIRKHVMTHGVAPRVHGNHGKIPHNTFPLDIYRHATKFLRKYIEEHTFNNVNGQSQQNGGVQTPVAPPGKKSKPSKPAPLYLPSDITKKHIHNAYREHCSKQELGIKIMGYSTFRHFMKEQFPYVKFCKIETKGNLQPGNNINGSEIDADGNIIHSALQKDHSENLSANLKEDSSSQLSHQRQQATILTANDMQQVAAIPVVLSDSSCLSQQQQTAFIVAPVSQILQTPHSLRESSTYTSYQLNAASDAYATQGNVGTITVSTVPGPSARSSYGFTTL